MNVQDLIEVLKQVNQEKPVINRLNEIIISIEKYGDSIELFSKKELTIDDLLKEK